MDIGGYPQIAILLVAWSISDLLMPVLIQVSRRRSWLDRPHGHKTHQEPTPVLGGVGIFIAVAASLALTLQTKPSETWFPIVGLFLGCFLVTVLGLIDDFRPINAVVKLGVLVAATVVISRFDVCANILPGGTSNPLNVAITLLWIVGVTSATNSLDHANGNTAGSIAIACGSIFVIAWGNSAETSQSWLSYLAVAIAGGCLGFLRHNLFGGRIFLGDNGSFLLGFLTASCLVFARWSDDPIKAFLMPVMILTVPLFDISLSTILRIKNGVVGSVREAIVYCGKDHLTHRLLALGLSPRASVLAVYSLGIVSGAFAIAIHGIESRISYLSVTAAYLVLLVIIGALLDQAPVHRNSRRSERFLPPRLRWPARAQAPRGDGRKKNPVASR